MITQINTEQLKDILFDTRGSTFCGFVAVMPQDRMNKTSRTTGLLNPFWEGRRCCLVKISRLSGQLNARYDKAVEKKVAKEITEERHLAGLPDLSEEEMIVAINERFIKGENWQQTVIREDGTITPFAEHKQTHELYLRVINQKVIGTPIYIDIRTNRQYTKDEVQQYLPVERDNTNQGLSPENQVLYNCYKLRGIRAMRLNKIVYRVRPHMEAEVEEVFRILNNRLSEIEIPQEV